MESKTPDFSLDPTSPPHFTYDFNTDPSSSPSGPAFDAFSAYSGGFGETSPRLGFGALALGTNAHTSAPFFQPPHHNHPQNVYPSTSPTAHSFTSTSTPGGRPFTPLEGTDLTTISPPLTLGHQEGSSYPGVSGSEVEETARADGRRSSTSPPSSASASASQGYSSARNARYNPMAGARPQRPTRKSARRGVRRDEDDVSDEDAEAMVEEPMDIGISSSDIIQRRREEIRRQRIESEQRRRDELRDGYAKLKYALPISNQKSSKVSLLDRAVTYIRQLETSQGSLQTRLDGAETELTRLRGVNEQLMRNLAEQHRAVMIAAANAQVVPSSASTTTVGSDPPSPAGAGQQKKTAKNKSSASSF